MKTHSFTYRNWHRVLSTSAALIAVVSLLWIGNPARAQNTTGTISGTVTDSTGAVIPGARVTVHSNATGFTRNTVSDGAGAYKFSLVPIGVYSVSAGKAGFQTHQLDNINVEILATDTANFSLAPGTSTQVVNVNASQVQLDTETSQAGTVIQGSQVNKLPLNVRQFMQLIYLAPMSTPASHDFRSTGIPRNVSAPASAGQRPAQNNYELDGFNNRETSRNGFAISPPVDSVGEFIVQTGMPPAEFGMGGGVIVNVVTQRGADKYHGALYEFIRNDIFDAKSYFASNKSPLKRNQFGAEFGGPIRSKNLTFFANYEGLRQAAQGNPAVGLVPTVAEKQGVFSTKITDPANGNAPFPNNTIPQDRINPISANLLKLFPDPNTTGNGYNFIFNNQPSGQLIYNTGLGRVDYNRGSKDTMFGRYLYDHEYTSTPPRLPLPAYSDGQIYQVMAQGMGGQWSHVISPTLVNTVGLDYTRYHNQYQSWNSYRQDFVTPAGISNTLAATNPLYWSTPNISVPGYLTPGDITPDTNSMNEYQLIENVVWAHGKHTLKFGADLEKTQTDIFYTSQISGFTFGNAYTGNDFADFLLGDASSVGKTSRAVPWNTWTWYGAGYAQDDWKATKNLTLNLGLRYEVQSAIRQSDKCGLGMSLANGLATEIVSNQCTDIQNILAFSQTVRPDVLVTTTKHDAPYNADTNNIAPRFGFAYALGTKTVLRGGAGIFYAAPEVTNLASSNSFAPNTLQLIWTSSPSTPTYGWNPGGTLAEEMQNTAFTVFPVLSRNLPYGVVQEWNLNVERELTNTLSLQVMYQGSHDVDLFGFDNSDFRAPGPGNVQKLLPYPQYARIQNFDTWGAAKYEGGSVRLQQTPARGLSYLIAYTYSKSMDNGSEEEQSPQWSDPFNRATAWGPSDFNATNRFSAAYTYQLPLGHGGLLLADVNDWENKVVNGWGVRGITTYQTGLPQTPTMNLSREGICATSCIARPDRVGNGNLPRGVRTMHRFYDVNAFKVLPAGGVSGRIGDSGRNILTGPPINDFDLQLFKQVHFADSQNVEFRWEMYNAFNHTQWSAPSVNMESPSTFGVITGTAAPRIMQFALRYSF